MKLPDKIFGIDLKEAYKKYLAEARRKPKIQPEQVTPANIQDPENYVLLPEIKEHPDLLIAKYGLGLTSEVEQAASSLNLNLKDTATEKNNHRYIGDIDHQQALDLVKALNSFVLPVEYFREHLKNLREGSLGNLVVYDGSGKPIFRPEAEDLFKEMTDIRTPWRAEHLNDRYIEKNNDIYVVRNKFDNGRLIQVEEILDPDTLIQSRVPGTSFLEISLDDWLDSSTEQGYPRKNIPDGSLSYWPPRENAVAGFGAISGWVSFDGFYCSMDRQDSRATLGVRVAREKI